MRTYLFTWNPKRWSWGKLPEEIVEINTYGVKEERWSTGNNRSIIKGDRFFLCKLGEHPKGIIGSGFVCSDGVYQDKHWLDQKSEANYADIIFDVLSETPIITEDDFNEPLFNSFIWFPQCSGISIPETISHALESLWELKTNSSNEFYISENTREFKEGGKKVVRTANYYERNQQARQECLKHHGYTCVVCGFNFEKFYGETGKNFIHVHHIKPVSEIKSEYKIDPVKDIMPVCANCHAMIHRTVPPQTIESLKEKISHCVSSNLNF